MVLKETEYSNTFKNEDVNYAKNALRQCQSNISLGSMQTPLETQANQQIKSTNNFTNLPQIHYQGNSSPDVKEATF